MTDEERRTFLAEVHTGVVSIPDGDRGPLTVPIWYRIDDDGDLLMVTPATSRKARRCDVGTRISLVAQDEELPPKYVSVEGPVVSVIPATIDDARMIAVRYLGEELGVAYVDATRADGSEPSDEVVIRMRPERWFSADFAKRF